MLKRIISMMLALFMVLGACPIVYMSENEAIETLNEAAQEGTDTEDAAAEDAEKTQDPADESDSLSQNEESEGNAEDQDTAASDEANQNPSSDYMQITADAVYHKAGITAPEGLAVVEAFVIDEAHCDTVQLTLTALPSLSDGETLAFCGLADDTPEAIRENLLVGDTAAVALNMFNGFALMKKLAKALEANPIEVSEEEKNEVDPVNPNDLPMEGSNERGKVETADGKSDKSETDVNSENPDPEGAKEDEEKQEETEYKTETILKKSLEASDGKTYQISVSYSGKASFPEEVELCVSEIAEAEKSYNTFINKAAQAVYLSSTDFSYVRLFDLSILGADGKAYPLDENVSVKIDLLEEADTSDLRVVKIGNRTEEVDADVEDATVSFEADESASVFAIVNVSLFEQEISASMKTAEGTKSGTLYENDDILLTGKMPSMGVVEAEPVFVEIEGQKVLAAYDIKIYANRLMKNLGISWQPSDGAIQVQVKSDVMDKVNTVSVYHIADGESTPELINEEVAVENGAVSFAAESFSVYVVVEHEGGTVVTPRVEFHFIGPDFEQVGSNGVTAFYATAPYQFKNKGEVENSHPTDYYTQTSQILKDGEALELIPDPLNKDDIYFYGWYVVSPYTEDSSTNDYGLNSSANKFYYTWPAGPDRVRFEQAINITESGGIVSWTLGSASGSGMVDADGNVHVLLAPLFENYHFVNFMQFARNSGAGASANNLMGRKLFALGSASSVEVKISDIAATSTDAVRLIFKGWEYNAGTEQAPNWVRLDTVDYTGDEICQTGKDGTYITVSDDIDLYPIFIEARWADFNVGYSGNGATYVASRFLLAWDESGSNVGMTDIEGQSVFAQLDAPTRKGYVFGGWYAGVTDYNASTGEFSTGERITDTAITDGKVSVLIPDTPIIGYETGTDSSQHKAWEVADGELKFYNGLSRLTLYAKWVPDSSNITIVYWTENAEDDNYFSRAVKTVTTAEINDQLNTSYASGSEITLADLQRYTIGDVGVLETAYLDDVGAVPAGEQIFYDLKTVAVDANDMHFEASKVISGDGTTLFNVYYSRKVFTLVFHIGRDGFVSTSGDQRSPNNGSWLQQFYNDAIATGYDTAEAIMPNGNRGVSQAAVVTMTYTHDETTETYTSEYQTDSAKVKNYYVPTSGENVYTIKAKYGAYIGDRWPSPSNSAFTFTNTSNKSMYIWSAYYGSRYCAIANARGASDNQGDHPDINGIYNYMSAELCSNREGTAIINDNQVHHFVAYFGNTSDLSKGRIKTYHILYEAVDGTYDPNNVEIVPGSDYATYNLTTWTTQTAHAHASLLSGRNFYQTKEYAVISNLQPQYQLSSDLEGYEQIYSCYNTPKTNEHHIYFFYRPKEYTITFKYENQADRKVDTYYYTQSLAEANKYDPPERTGYEFLGWYTNEAGAGEPFDFEHSTMSAMNLVLYPVMKALQYRVEIDPNGAEIDHINHTQVYNNGSNLYDASGRGAFNRGVLYKLDPVIGELVLDDQNQPILERPADSGYRRDQSTYFNATYGEPIGQYTLNPRQYVPISDTDAANYHGHIYYYVNMQFEETDGDHGISSHLRNALYVEGTYGTGQYKNDDSSQGVTELYDLWDFYYKVSEVNKNNGTLPNTTLLSFEDWKAAYVSTQKYRHISESEHWTFMGWYQVFDNGAEAYMPYNFNDPIYGEVKLRAKWRLDGGIYVKYNPYFFVEEEIGGNTTITAVIGEVEQWTDPANPGSQLYADQSKTHILRAPTDISSTDGQTWIFRGWRVVRPEGTSSMLGYNGQNYTYQQWTPIQLDGSENPIYYSPGDDFTIDSALISETDSHGSIIHMQAYYEPLSESYRHPEVTNLILDANDEYGGYVNTTESNSLPALTGPGHQAINTTTELDDSSNPTQILIGDIQSNLALHLYRYATTKMHSGVTGTNFFSHSDNYFLLGFDENSDPNNLTTGQPYIPAFAADAVAAVTRNDNRTLYAIWEPMVYVTFVNTTGVDLVIDLTGTGTNTISIVNEVTGDFDREQSATTITVPAKSGGTDGRVKVVFPGAVPGTDCITATAVNNQSDKLLTVKGTYPGEAVYGDGHEDIPYGYPVIYTGLLVTDANGIVVTYTEKELQDRVYFDVNGGTWTETAPAYVDVTGTASLYAIKRVDIGNNNQYEPADPTREEKIFLGWTTNADIAAHTDFSSQTTVYWGSTTITPDSGSIVLDKIRSNYLWNFTQNPPYNQTLYAVWSDAVTVIFDVLRTGSKLHNWTGPATTNTLGPYVFYRQNDSAQTITYTVCKGETVPEPQDPTVETTWNKAYIFLDWVTNNSKINTSTNPPAISDILFDFTAPVLENRTVYTSWFDTQYMRIYTYTVENKVISDNAEDEEFEYTIAAVSNMNVSGTYYNSSPTTILPVKTKLKNNETYTVKVTGVRYRASNWDHNSLYLNVIDRNGVTIASGYMMVCGSDYETSDYQVTLTVTQTPKAGYTTTVTSDAGAATTVDLGAKTYTFGIGRTNPSTTTYVNTENDSFTFRSSTGNNTTQFVGEKQNADYGTSVLDVSETITFTNSTGLLPAPTGFSARIRPFALMLVLGLFLIPVMQSSRRRKKEED